MCVCVCVQVGETEAKKQEKSRLCSSRLKQTGKMKNQTIEWSQLNFLEVGATPLFPSVKPPASQRSGQIKDSALALAGFRVKKEKIEKNKNPGNLLEKQPVK